MVLQQGRKLPSSCRNHWRFNSVAKGSECPDHSRSPSSLSLFTDSGTAFLIVNTVVQNDPDQLTEAMCNGSDGFVVSQAKQQTTIDDLEDAPFVFDGSIGSLIENAAHLTVALGRALVAVHTCALIIARACSYPGDEILGGSEGRCLGTDLGNDLLR